MKLLTPDEIKAAAALAARHGEERALLAGRQENERRELAAKQEAEFRALAKPAAAAAPVVSRSVLPDARPGKVRRAK